ncbi:MAG TPA: amidohydrolase family protein [Candidatus Limnocylindrales bacterium]|nr:amidohydrolase family protein [Candidatus Limnocylindrales bacterium]
MNLSRRTLLGFAWLSTGLLLASGAEEPKKLAITHVSVVDTKSGELKVNQTIVLASGKILRIFPSADYRPEPGAQVIDARGKFLIPGLWDMHVHIAGISADPKWSKDVILPLLTAMGVTGVRDMGGDLTVLQAWRREIESGKRIGPHIVAGGPMLVSRGKKTPEQIPITNAEEAREAVRSLKLAGADFIKIIDLPSREAFFAVADEAKRQKLPFVGHVPSVVTASEASDAGMHSIEHVVYSNLEMDCSAKEDELRARERAARATHEAGTSARLLQEAMTSYDPQKAAALWERFRRNGTWLVPTLVSIEALSRHNAAPETQANDPRLEFVPDSLRKEWDPRTPENKFSEGEQRWWAQQYINDGKMTAAMHKGGVAFLAGSDSLDHFVFPGFALHRELELLTEAGMTPLEALRAATSDAARFLGREGEFGVVASGARADLLLLDENPLAEISNTTKISAVIRDGVYLDRAALDLMLKRAKAAAKAASLH